MTHDNPLIWCGDWRDYLHRLENSIDLTVTSPPYDNIRNYGGKWSAGIFELGKDLLSVTTEGGVCAMVLQDGTEEGVKSGTTFRTATSWMDLGWNLFETVIWRRGGTPGAWWTHRFRVDHEFILLFFKGKRIRYFNKDSLKIPTTYGGSLQQHDFVRSTNGKMIGSGHRKEVAPFKCRGTVWENQKSCTEQNRLKSKHPATFPDSLARDLIACFSKRGDTVCDPYVGSGTTLVEAVRARRIFIGGDINSKYVQIAKARCIGETLRSARKIRILPDKL